MLSQDKKNDIKTIGLIEIENMFTGISHKNNTKENHEMMLFLPDIESRLKQTLMEVDS